MVYVGLIAQRRTETLFLHKPHPVPNLSEIYPVLIYVQRLFLRHVIYRICCIDKVRNYRLRTLCTQTDQDRI